MDLRPTLVLAVAIVAGFALHALLQPDPWDAGTAARAAYGLQPIVKVSDIRDVRGSAAAEAAIDAALLEAATPRVLRVDGRDLIYDPSFTRKGGGYELTGKYLQLLDGTLVEVEIRDPAPRQGPAVETR